LDILDAPLEVEWQQALRTAKEMGGSISYRQLDITDQAAVQRVVGEIYDGCQVEITGFFGAAGIQQMIPALEYPVEQFRKMMDVNVTGELPVSCATSITQAEMVTLALRVSRYVLDHSSGGTTDETTWDRREHRHDRQHVRVYRKQG
jgi:NAD(P)-dependent dehydrogenase (short-subunit alcohol dehydrogenase family)